MNTDRSQNSSVSSGGAEVSLHSQTFATNSPVTLLKEESFTGFVIKNEVDD